MIPNFGPLHVTLAVKDNAATVGTVEKTIPRTMATVMKTLFNPIKATTRVVVFKPVKTKVDPINLTPAAWCLSWAILGSLGFFSGLSGP